MTGLSNDADSTNELEIASIPEREASLEEILKRRIEECERRRLEDEVTKLIPVKVKENCPIGISFFGDPHLDDPGTDIALLQRDMAIVKNTPGLYGACVGDMQDNWVGRLARLYAHQETTDKAALKLIEWFIQEVDWLFIVGGNHDVWSGTQDPLEWLCKLGNKTYRRYGARIGLNFPNGKQVRINCRHSWNGNSQWNPAHGPMKAAQMGTTDHILICGHKHVAGYGPIYNATNDLLSHGAIVGSYKLFDDYVEEKGFAKSNFTQNIVFVIDPNADRQTRLVTTFLDIEAGAEYLQMLRRQYKQGIKKVVRHVDEE